MIRAAWDVRQRQVRDGPNEHGPVLVLIVHAVWDHLLGECLLGEACMRRHTVLQHGAIVRVKCGQHTKLALVVRRGPLHRGKRRRGQGMAPLRWRPEAAQVGGGLRNEEGGTCHGT